MTGKKNYEQAHEGITLMRVFIAADGRLTAVADDNLGLSTDYLARIADEIELAMIGSSAYTNYKNQLPI